MFKRMALLWVIVLVTLVPWSIYHLLYHAQRDEYAFLVTFVLFWIFGFWGVAGPLLSALKVRSVMSALETTRSGGAVQALIRGNVARDVVVELIAAENRVPRWLAGRIYESMIRRLAMAGNPPVR